MMGATPAAPQQEDRMPERRQLYSQSTPAQLRTLSRSQVVDKQVITRTSGLQLGIISHFLIDPRTATVVYLSLRAKGLGGQDMGMVPLSALTQIGDVVLVHDESAVVDDALRTRGLVKLVGHSVQSYDGTPLGKVRDFAFSPDSGQITHLSYDSLGLPTVPEALLNVYEVDMDSVLELRSGLVVLRRGAERSTILVSSGILGYAFDKIQEVFDSLKGSDMGDELYVEGMDDAFLEWRAQHGQEWARYYGLTELPSSRAQVDSMTARTRNMLPPPRQAAQLLSREAPRSTPLRDPRTQRQPYSEAGVAPRRQSRLSSRPAQQPEASTSASVPILDTRPLPAYRRRDADGGLGERPAPDEQPQEAQSGIPFEQFVVREPFRARRLELEPSGPPNQPQYAPASARSQQLEYSSDRNGSSDQRIPPRQSNNSGWSQSQQPGQAESRDPARQSTRGGSGLPRRVRSTARGGMPDQAWPATSGAAADVQGAAKSEAERMQEADRLAQIRRDLPDWRQERDAPLYNTPYKEYRLRRH
ncbi:g10890 [Coccomyxa viridis]|uniref:G10890 protein n=1 Tax=Coccomyxa viridis TaxID=1274662 RepID=A0ABP1G6G1_9CHLO